MTDVLKIALERRAKMQEEVDRLDDFIRTAESLISNGGSVATMAPAAQPAPAPEPAPAEATPMTLSRRSDEAAPRSAPAAESNEGTDVPRPNIIRRGLAS